MFRVTQVAGVRWKYGGNKRNPDLCPDSKLLPAAHRRISVYSTRSRQLLFTCLHVHMFTCLLYISTHDRQLTGPRPDLDSLFTCGTNMGCRCEAAFLEQATPEHSLKLPLPPGASGPGRTSSVPLPPSRSLEILPVPQCRWMFLSGTLLSV